MNTRTLVGSVRPRHLGMLLLCALMAAPGCKGHAQRDASRRDAKQTQSALARAPITIDGRMDDWPANAATMADADWIYFKVTVQGLDAPLQASPETIALWLDADASGKTGAHMSLPPEAAGLGVDEIAEFSPPPQSGTSGRGVIVYASDTSGHSTSIPSAQAEVLSAPTCASDTYEVRLSRHIDAAGAPQLAKLLHSKGKARAMFALIGRDGKLTGWSDPETFSMPAASAAPPAKDAAVPPKSDGGIRVLSWNVLKSELMKNPGPFARVIQVLDPDIILLQEWETDGPSAQAWFTATVTGKHSWNAWASREGGVAIISPYPLSTVGPQTISTESGEEKSRLVRFISAAVTTPAGAVLVGTAHLKCCGTAGSPEDQRRVAEASAINAAMSRAFTEAKVPVRIIAGDFNLVGTRAPLDILRAGLDADGSELAVAQSGVLGDNAIYTWSDHQTEFPDGRLDYAVYSDASADLVDAFVLDGRRLGDKTLARLGLDRTDTGASDHLPLVVDLRPRK